MPEKSNSPGVPLNRFEALDALRGLAILGMVLSGNLPFGTKSLPAWMYHAQCPPPSHEFVDNLPGITWVDLVFPIFLFSLGAAIPLALNRRVEAGAGKSQIALFIAERGLLLAFFALYVDAIRPGVILDPPRTWTWLVGLLGFLLLFPILSRLPAKWPAVYRWGIRAAGWLGAIALLSTLRYPNGSGFSLGRSDIIIVVLANVAVFGTLLWWLTRANLLLRLGVLAILFAVRLSNRPHPFEGWVHDVWQWSPAPWIYQLYYLQYLFIVVPGTIAGDLIVQWQKTPTLASSNSWSAAKMATLAALMLALVVEMLIGLKCRWVAGTVLLTAALCALGYSLMARPVTPREQLFKKLFSWAIFWLALGLCFEPYEGGIKKDHPTLSYYFVTSGLAICLLIAFTIALDRYRRGFRLLIDNGQNPMLAYAGINNLVHPLLALTGITTLLGTMTAPWLGFLRGVIITLLLALAVSAFTRARILWRS